MRGGGLAFLLFEGGEGCEGGGGGGVGVGGAGMLSGVCVRGCGRGTVYRLERKHVCVGGGGTGELGGGGVPWRGRVGCMSVYACVG